MVHPKVRFVATGTGRCGTHTVAQAMWDAGVPCGHEEAFTPYRHGTGDWVAEASWLAAPYIPFPNTYTVHLIRHPLDYIRSRLGRRTFATGNAWEQFTEHHCPAMKALTDPVDRVATHWVHWNQMIQADEVVRIEDLTVEHVRRWAKLVSPYAALDQLPPPRAVTHDRYKHSEITWDDVKHIPGLLELAQAHRYLTKSNG